MAQDTFFVDVYRPPTLDLLRAKMDRTSFVDSLDHPVLEGLLMYFKDCLKFNYEQDGRSRREVMPLHDSFTRLRQSHVNELRDITDSLVVTHQETPYQIYHFLKDHGPMLDNLIQEHGLVYANEAIRLVFQEIAELGSLG